MLLLVGTPDSMRTQTHNSGEVFHGTLAEAMARVEAQVNAAWSASEFVCEPWHESWRGDGVWELVVWDRFPREVNGKTQRWCRCVNRILPRDTVTP